MVDTREIFNDDDVVVTLEEIPKWTSKSEWYPTNKITCKEFNLSITGDGYIVKRMAKLLAAENCGISRGYRVMRGEQLIFKIMPLNSWVNPPDRTPVNLRKKDKVYG